MEISLSVFIFFFGALWGSFFYTLSLRYANGSMAAHPFRALFSSSRCPSCAEKISPLYLVPLLGFLALRGKCKNCGASISWIYPAAEISSGLLLLFMTQTMGFYPGTMFTFMLIQTAAAISIVDVKTLTIPDSLIALFLILSLYPMILHNTFRDSLYGLILMSLFFMVILLIFPGSFGGGDVKFSAMIGLYSGLELSLVVLETALITGALAGVFYAVITKKGFRSKIPFGPFLALGLVVSILYGRDIILIYYRFMR